MFCHLQVEVKYNYTNKSFHQLVQCVILKCNHFTYNTRAGFHIHLIQQHFTYFRHIIQEY